MNELLRQRRDLYEAKLSSPRDHYLPEWLLNAYIKIAKKREGMQNIFILVNKFQNAGSIISNKLKELIYEHCTSDVYQFKHLKDTNFDLKSIYAAKEYYKLSASPTSSTFTPKLSEQHEHLEAALRLEPKNEVILNQDYVPPQNLIYDEGPAIRTMIDNEHENPDIKFLKDSGMFFSKAND